MKIRQEVLTKGWRFYYQFLKFLLQKNCTVKIVENFYCKTEIFPTVQKTYLEFQHWLLFRLMLTELEPSDFSVAFKWTQIPGEKKN